MSQSDRRFACPGLYRIVPSLDGGICRIKLSRGRVAAAQMRALAALAEEYGHPEIEATNRANIQIRGVKPGAEDAVIAGLKAAGLAPENSGADDVRNVMVSPYCGLDGDALIDVSSLADKVLERLMRETRYHALSPKFSIQIDGGEAVAMTEHPNDIWLSAMDGDHFAFGFASVPGERPAGAVAASDAETALFALLDTFIAEIGRRNAKGDKIARMRHLLVDRDGSTLAAALPVTVHAVGDWQREAPMPLGHIGARAQKDGRVAIGAVPPLGRIGQKMMLGLADLADRVSGAEIRMTPWQSVLLPGIAEDEAAEAAETLEELGFITRPDRTLAATITCAGSTGCKSGLADTKGDALALAQELDGWAHPVFGIHLTGCAKSCAAPRPAPFTLVALTPGHYDLFAAGDRERAGFGKRIGADLTIEQAAQLLRQREQA
ncbi:precorrin-3B synthase [Dongia sp.]|uniref:precorrin-3B synthase n=1 Tax=Dongia sp. TaxID=1977262 RepID=UPI0035B0C3B9